MSAPYGGMGTQFQGGPPSSYPGTPFQPGTQAMMPPSTMGQMGPPPQYMSGPPGGSMNARPMGPYGQSMGMPPQYAAMGAQPSMGMPPQSSPMGMRPQSAPMGAPPSMGAPPPMQGQFQSGINRPHTTAVANPPVVAANVQYGPSYKMQNQKRSTADKTAVKYTGFLPLEGVYEEDTCRVG
eukprot:NODE_22758_length_695_cov_6.149648.p1 GENE.NODE_22758_length_695_cov_6.149648~~NODE_22758_length_695_cov_6.149648.p1  ORF type:complete len:210 (+),score=57.15 NODE_22758_length_695_cov_6.149648:89-631(+)